MVKARSRNGRQVGGIGPLAPAPINAAALVNIDDVQQVLDKNPVASLQAQVFALQRIMAEKDNEILELTIRLGEKKLVEGKKS